MKNLLVNYGGILIFYIVAILGIIYLCFPNSNVKSNNFKLSTFTEVTK